MCYNTPMSELFKLEKPNLSRIRQDKLLKIFFENQDELTDKIVDTFYPKYLYWDEAKYKARPKNLTPEEFWKLIKIARTSRLPKKTPIKSENGKHFTWIQLPQLEPFFHEVDLNTGGSLLSNRKEIDESNRNRFISRGLMEEAIASSQLEGAHTTRKLAKEFLREGRKPKNHAEQMILNNYQTILAIEESYKNKELDLKTIFDLHAMISSKTIPTADLYRLRTDEDDIIVSDSDNTIYHIPPKKAFLEAELEKLICFANDELKDSFTHPVIKAILLHFWIGYLHPFTDGNGRLARLLFYWYLLKKGYWAFAYLPISLMIKKSPSQYQKAFIYSEQDDNDLTYFIDFNIRKIEQAVDDFNNYLDIKYKSNIETKFYKKALSKYDLNERQILLLNYYNQEPDRWTTPTTHMNIYQISKKTAITDLKKLHELGFIRPTKKGRHVYYYATNKIANILQS